MLIIDIVGQGQGALKFALHYFAAKILAFFLFFFLCRRPDGNCLIVDRYLQVIFIDARQGGMNLYFIVMIDNINFWKAFFQPGRKISV